MRRADRTRYIEAIANTGFTARAFFFEVSPREAVGRNTDRPEDERIPPWAIYQTFNALEVPQPDEGFSSVVRVTPGAGGGFVADAGAGHAT